MKQSQVAVMERARSLFCSMIWKALLLLLLFFISCVLSSKGDAQGEPIHSSAFSVRFADNVEMCKDPQMIFLLECKRPNDNLPEKCLLRIVSRTETCYTVEDGGNHSYILHSPTSKMSQHVKNASNVCSIPIAGSEMRVPIGGYPNFNESRMVAKLCFMNGSDCQPVSSYHNGINNNDKYKDRIDFNKETGTFYLLNPTESDSGMYRYTVIKEDQNSMTVTETTTVHLLSGVCSEGNTGDNTGLIAGLIIAGLLLLVVVVVVVVGVVVYAVKRRRLKSSSSRTSQQNSPEDPDQAPGKKKNRGTKSERKENRVLLIDQSADRSKRSGKTKEKKGSAGQTEEQQNVEKYSLMGNGEKLSQADSRRRPRRPRRRRKKTKTGAAPL